MTATADPLPAVAVRATSKDDEFRAFYAEQYADVAGYCFALTADPALADELAQEAMVAVYVRWARLSTPRGYAFRVAQHLARNHWRRRNREYATWSELTTHAVGTGHLDGTIWDAVRRLPPAQRDVVFLHYLYDLPLADVATAIRRPLGTVKRRLHEARALLAKALEGTR